MTEFSLSLNNFQISLKLLLFVLYLLLLNLNLGISQLVGMVCQLRFTAHNGGVQIRVSELQNYITFLHHLPLFNIDFLHFSAFFHIKINSTNWFNLPNNGDVVVKLTIHDRADT